MTDEQCRTCNGSGLHPMTNSTHCPSCMGVGIKLIHDSPGSEPTA